MMDKNCYFCTNNIKTVDYTEVELLRRFTDQQAKIVPAKKTGICAKHQRKLARAIKRARFLSLMPHISR